MSTSPERSNGGLTDEASEEVGKQLQLTLVELIALALAGKQLHWNAYGRDFLTVHRYLDQVVDEWHELSDSIAERAAAIGIAPDGSAATILELGDLRAPEPGFTEIGAGIERLCAQLAEVAGRVRVRAATVGQLDAVSEDALIAVERKLEEQVWMMRAQLTD